MNDQPFFIPNFRFKISDCSSVFYRSGNLLARVEIAAKVAGSFSFCFGIADRLLGLAGLNFQINDKIAQYHCAIAIFIHFCIKLS